MDDQELKRLETTYRKKTGKNPEITIPKKGDPADIPEFLKRGQLAKEALEAARKRLDESAVRKNQTYIDNLKRTIRARAIQKELNRIEGKPGGYITPWPDLP